MIMPYETLNIFSAPISKSKTLDLYNTFLELKLYGPSLTFLFVNRSIH